MPIPPLLSPSLVGNACGCSRRAAISLLRGAGILERVGGRMYVGEGRLRERLPDVYDRVYTYIELRPELTSEADS